MSSKNADPAADETPTPAVALHALQSRAEVEEHPLADGVGSLFAVQATGGRRVENLDHVFRRWPGDRFPRPWGRASDGSRCLRFRRLVFRVMYSLRVAHVHQVADARVRRLILGDATDDHTEDDDDDGRSIVGRSLHPPAGPTAPVALAMADLRPTAGATGTGGRRTRPQQPVPVRPSSASDDSDKETDASRRAPPRRAADPAAPFISGGASPENVKLFRAVAAGSAAALATEEDIGLSTALFAPGGKLYVRGSACGACVSVCVRPDRVRAGCSFPRATDEHAIFGEQTSREDRAAFFAALAVASPDRTPTQLTTLQTLLSRVPFFRDVPAPIVAVVCRHMGVAAFAEGETVCAQGAPNDCFFMVITGHVDVLVSKSAGFTAVGARLQPGNTIGELAVRVTGELPPRAATCVAVSADTTLLTVTHDVAAHIRDLGARDTDARVRFLQSAPRLPLLADVPDETLHQLAALLETQRLPLHGIVVTEGTPSLQLAWVAQGTVQLIKKVAMPAQWRDHLATMDGTSLHPNPLADPLADPVRDPLHYEEGPPTHRLPPPEGTPPLPPPPPPLRSLMAELDTDPDARPKFKAGSTSVMAGSRSASTASLRSSADSKSTVWEIAELDTLGRGDVFGFFPNEFGLPDRAPFSVYATSAVVLYTLPAPDALSLLPSETGAALRAHCEARRVTSLVVQRELRQQAQWAQYKEKLVRTSHVAHLGERQRVKGTNPFIAPVSGPLMQTEYPAAPDFTVAAQLSKDRRAHV